MLTLGPHSTSAAEDSSQPVNQPVNKCSATEKKHDIDDDNIVFDDDDDSDGDAWFGEDNDYEG